MTLKSDQQAPSCGTAGVPELTHYSSYFTSTPVPHQPCFAEKGARGKAVLRRTMNELTVGQRSCNSDWISTNCALLLLRSIAKGHCQVPFAEKC